jgi:ankyrin repeat protein
VQFINIVFALFYALSIFSMEKVDEWEYLQGIVADHQTKAQKIQANAHQFKKIFGNPDLWWAINNLAIANQAKRLVLLFEEIAPFVDIKATLNRNRVDHIPVLHHALANKTVNKEIIEILLRYGADPNITLLNDHGTTKKGNRFLYQGWNAGHIAVRTNKDEAILELLRQFETDFWHEDCAGWTAQMLAVRHSMEIALRFFWQNNYLRTAYSDE